MQLTCLPLILILETLHEQGLSIHQVPAKHHCTRLQRPEHPIGQEPVEQAEIFCLAPCENSLSWCLLKI